MYKQVVVIRTDLKMGKGKIAAQVAHASLAAYKKAGLIAKRRWDAAGSKKIVVKVGSLKELIDVYNKAKDHDLKPVMISDAGKTQISSGTKTCVGIGPDKDEKIDKITKNLKLLG